MDTEMTIQEQYASNLKHERHRNYTELIYWNDQWKLLAKNAIEQLNNQPNWKDWQEHVDNLSKLADARRIVIREQDEQLDAAQQQIAQLTAENAQLRATCTRCGQSAGHTVGCPNEKVWITQGAWSR